MAHKLARLALICVCLGGSAPTFAVDCNTVDPPPDDGFSIQGYAEDGGTDPAALEESIREFTITPYGTSFFVDRWLKTDGLTPNTGKITLGVAFLGGTDAQRSAVKNLAPKWLDGNVGSFLSFRFDVDKGAAQIRIAFDPKAGNNSYVGRRALSVPADIATMNLQDVKQRQIFHEFGHAIGLLHEHMHPKAGIAWNEQVVIAELKKNYGWSEKYVRQNVLAHFSAEAACVGDPSMNRKSIMIYQIPPHWTVNGYSTPLVQDISPRDRSCILGLYKR